ncbi:MAG TPA: fasciclin domain-containing protein [Roseomonas sp.]
MLLTRRFALITSGAAAFLAACTTEQIRADGSYPLLTVLGAQPDLSEFRRALTRANLDQMLEGDGPFTVIAPTNAAWAQAPQAMKDGNADALRNLIARGRLRRNDIQAREGRIRMLGGIDVRVVGGTPQQPRIQAARAGGNPSGASGTITRPDLLCRNGVIQVVDAVLVPAA